MAFPCQVLSKVQNWALNATSLSLESPEIVAEIQPFVTSDTSVQYAISAGYEEGGVSSFVKCDQKITEVHTEKASTDLLRLLT